MSSPKTFEEWSKLGYRIEKGSKAYIRKSDGAKVFLEKQVYKPQYYEGDYEDDAEQANYYGIDGW